MGKCPPSGQTEPTQRKRRPAKAAMGRQKKLMSIPAKCRRLAFPRSSGQRVTVTRLVRRERVLLPAAEQWDERTGRHDDAPAAILTHYLR